MDLNLIHLFITIVDAGSMSEAARRLSITRSHVSRRLQLLERTLGNQLIRRTTRSIDLTSDGLTLYEHGRRMMDELEVARARLQESHEQPSGHVRVSIPTGLAEAGLSDALLAFAQAHPGLTLRLYLSNRVADLVDAEIDVALRVLTDPPPHYVAREVCEVTWHLCCSPAYRDQAGGIHTPEDLARCNLLCLPASRRGLVMTLWRQARTWNVPLHPVLESEDFPFLARAAKAGSGVALLPLYLVRDDLRAGKLCQVLSDYTVQSPGSTLFVLTNPNPYPNSATRALVAFLQRAVRDLGCVPESAGRGV